ncbi:MAG: glycosyltransferase family 2 protein [Caldilineaceae bacterium]|nr:glycosyltransferase family 2 protein [Caldilineaceae bacterium]
MDRPRAYEIANYGSYLVIAGASCYSSRMDKPIDLAIVIVSWNVWDLLRACLASIAADSDPTDDPHVRRFGPQREASLHVIVVDNASSDATPSLLPSQFPWVRTILSAENLGFTGGNNAGLAALGLEKAKGKGQKAKVTADRRRRTADGGPQTAVPDPQSPVPSPQYVYFLNPDTELLPNSLWTLYRAIVGDERVGAVGPQLLYGDGTRQSTRRRFPSPLTGFFESTWLGQLWPTNPWARRYHIDDWPDNVRQDVDWVVGAALMVRWVVLESVGGFDDGFFMYSEELDLCKRIKKAGWRVVYDPAAIVIHYEGRSSGQVSTRRHILFNRSKVRYYRKTFGPIWAEVLRRFLLMEFRWQIAVESLKAIIGHKRDLRQARIAGYKAVLNSNLRDPYLD